MTKCVICEAEFIAPPTKRRPRRIRQTCSKRCATALAWRNPETAQKWAQARRVYYGTMTDEQRAAFLAMGAVAASEAMNRWWAERGDAERQRRRARAFERLFPRRLPVAPRCGFEGELQRPSETQLMAGR